MAAALIDGTPWPCSVARAGQGDRPSSVGKDGRSWGMVVPPGPAGRERWAGRRSHQRYVGLLTRRTPRPPGGNERGASSRPPTGRHHVGASPLSSPGKPKPPALFKRRGAGRTSPRAESPRPMRQARSFSNARTSFTRRLWPGRVNPTLGCQRQHQRPGGPATPLAAPNAEPWRPARVAIPFPPVWRLPPLEQERRHLAVLVEDKPPKPMGRRVQPGGLGRPGCALSRRGSLSHTRIAVLARLTWGSRRGLHQARRGGPQECGAGGRGLPRPPGGRPGPPTIAADTSSGGRTGPAPAPLSGPHAHGRSSAVAFDGRPPNRGYATSTHDADPNSTLEVSDRAPSPRWMNQPGHRPGDSEAGRGVHDPQSPQTRAAGGWAACPDSSYQRGARSRHVRRGARRQGLSKGRRVHTRRLTGLVTCLRDTGPARRTSTWPSTRPRPWRSGRAPAVPTGGNDATNPGVQCRVRFC